MFLYQKKYDFLLIAGPHSSTNDSNRSLILTSEPASPNTPEEGSAPCDSDDGVNKTNESDNNSDNEDVLLTPRFESVGTQQTDLTFSCSRQEFTSEGFRAGTELYLLS